MKPGISPFIYWTPRVLSMLFILFLLLFSLDVFSENLSWQQMIIAFLIHNVPVIILSIVLAISWKYEIAGGIVFILAGSLYILQMIINAINDSFAMYMISYSLTISGPAFLIGLLFILNWQQKNCIRK